MLFLILVLNLVKKIVTVLLFINSRNEYNTNQKFEYTKVLSFSYIII